MSMRLSKASLTVALVIALILLASTAQAEYVIGDHDFGGATVTITSWDPRTPTEGTDIYERWMQTEADFNADVKFAVIPLAEAVEQIVAGVMAGQAPTNMHEVQTERLFSSLAANGALLPLEDVLSDFYEDLPQEYQGSSGFRAASSFNGHAYGFPSGEPPYMTAAVLIWNKKMLEDAGLPSIYELMKNGEWTWDKMRELAIDLTKDTDGDGVIDQWGLGDIYWSYWMFLGANDAPLTRVTNGKVEFAADSTAVLETFNYVRQLIHEDKVVATVGFPDIVNQMREGKIAMYPAAFWISCEMAREEDLGIAYMPVGPSSDGFCAPTMGIPMMTITATSADPRGLVDLYYSIYGEPADLIEVRTDEFASIQTDFESYSLVYDFVTKWEIVDPYMKILLDAGFGNAWGEAVAGATNTPASALQEIAPVMQAALDDFLIQ